MQLGPDDVLVIEGIHGLNDKLSYSLPKESKYRIYISALTQLSIDEHNPVLHLKASKAHVLAYYFEVFTVFSFYMQKKLIELWILCAPKNRFLNLLRNHNFLVIGYSSLNYRVIVSKKHVVSCSCCPIELKCYFQFRLSKLLIQKNSHLKVIEMNCRNEL